MRIVWIKMKKIFLAILLVLVTGAEIALSWIAPFYWYWSVIFTALSAFSIFAFYFTNYKLKKLHRIATLLYIVVAVVIAFFILYYWLGFAKFFSNMENVKEWILGYGALSWIMFFVIQLLQVIILPLPSQVTTIPGAIIFGGLKCFLISSVAIIIGSLMCFGVGKIFGLKIAYKLGSKETVDKYRNLLFKRGRILLPIFFLFPFFPDDLICIISGTTSMTWGFFSIVCTLTRLIGVACTCFFLSGELIPFSGWGIPVWIIIAIAMLILVFFLLKYQDKFEESIIKFFSRKKKSLEQNGIEKNDFADTSKKEVSNVKSNEKENLQENLTEVKK